MLGETSIFTLPCKVPLWQNCQNDVLCGNMNMDVSHYISRYKFFFRNTCSAMTAWNYVCLSQPKSEIKYLPNKTCVIIIHTNTIHILDMPCYHQDQQQRYRNENTKIYMFIHYMYVDMLLSLTKGHFNYV